MRPIEFTTSYAAVDDDSIALSQAAAGAQALTLNGVLVTLGIAYLSTPGYIEITSGGDDTGITFAVVGKSPEGWAQTETITGHNAGAAVSTKSWSTVASVTTSGAVATTVKVGTVAAGYGPWRPLDIYVPNQVTTISTVVAGTINYTWQFTNDDIWLGDPTLITAFSHPTAALVGATTTQYGSVTTLMRAVRQLITSSTPTAASVRNVITQQSTQ